MIRNLFINLTILLVTTLIGIYALEFSIRALFPHYDPSGHVGFVNTPEGVILAKNRGVLWQIEKYQRL